VLALPDVKRRLLELGIEARPSSPEELTTLFKADVRKWDDVIAHAGIEKR
jgi:tripartite-type tricarboxylate transporter receptor subunit TctC